MLQHKKEMTEKSYYELKMMCIFVKLGSCSTLLKSLNSTLKVSIQKQKEQSWRYNHNSHTHKALHEFFSNGHEHDLSSNFYILTKSTKTISSSYSGVKRPFNV